MTRHPRPRGRYRTTATAGANVTTSHAMAGVCHRPWADRAKGVPVQAAGPIPRVTTRGRRTRDRASSSLGARDGRLRTHRAPGQSPRGQMLSTLARSQVESGRRIIAIIAIMAGSATCAPAIIGRPASDRRPGLSRQCRGRAGEHRRDHRDHACDRPVSLPAVAGHAPHEEKLQPGRSAGTRRSPRRVLEVAAAQQRDPTRVVGVLDRGLQRPPEGDQARRRPGWGGGPARTVEGRPQAAGGRHGAQGDEATGAARNMFARSVDSAIAGGRASASSPRAGVVVGRGYSPRSRVHLDGRP